MNLNKEMAESKINPEWIKATHVVAWVGPGFPSIEEQLKEDAEIQERMKIKYPEFFDEEKK